MPDRRDTWSSGDAYEPYVGRWSRLVARDFLQWLDQPESLRWLDVGCGTGALSETGVGNIWNAPLRPGDGGEHFKQAFESRILPALRNFAPDVVLISAGFDAHRDDPLANLQLTEPDFAWATERIADVAGEHAGGRLVSMLEGGYNLAALARSAAVHVGVLMRAGG